MIIKNFKKIKTEDPKVIAFSTIINLFNLKHTIYPHEETSYQNPITTNILNTTPIVLGAILDNTEKGLIFNNEIYILDGHHRFKYIVENSINKDLEVVLVNIENINIDCYNSELIVEKKVFIKKIVDDFGFSTTKMHNDIFIQIDTTDYYSDKPISIRELYSYKKELMKEKFISPIANNTFTSKNIIRFSPLAVSDFSKDYIFPYKSTWITPRFDN